MKLSLLAISLTLAVPALVVAQAPSDQDYSTTTPTDDTSFLQDNATSTPTTDNPDGALADGDYNTTLPTDDTSYMADSATTQPIAEPTQDATTDGSPAETPGATIGGTAKTPGFEVAAIAGAVALVALLLRRR